MSERWKQYFEQLHNCLAVTTTFPYKDYITCEPEINESSFKKVEENINKLKNNKVAGFDRITAEQIKYGVKRSNNQTTQINQLHLVNEKLPGDWKDNLYSQKGR